MLVFISCYRCFKISHLRVFCHPFYIFSVDERNWVSEFLSKLFSLRSNKLLWRNSVSSSPPFYFFHASYLLNKKPSDFIFTFIQFRTNLGPLSLALGLLPQSNSSTAKLILLEKLYLNWLAPLVSHPWSFLYLSLFSKICSRSLIFPAEQTSKKSVFPNIFT